MVCLYALVSVAKNATSAIEKNRRKGKKTMTIQNLLAAIGFTTALLAGVCAGRAQVVPTQSAGAVDGALCTENAQCQSGNCVVAKNNPEIKYCEAKSDPRCRENGRECSGDGECCKSNCVTPKNGKMYCDDKADPPTKACSTNGQACAVNRDCCGDMTCVHAKNPGEKKVAWYCEPSTK